MIVEIKNALVCDVIRGNYEGHPYISGVVYEKGKTYRLKIKDESIASTLESSLAEYVDCVCEFSTYHDKMKFTLKSVNLVD